MTNAMNDQEKIEWAVCSYDEMIEGIGHLSSTDDAQMILDYWESNEACTIRNKYPNAHRDEDGELILE